jgi:outer membrane protein OmpA-like peptidoglycan-associated protein
MNWFGRSSTELDYAYRPMDAFDTQAHYFSLSFNFGQTQPVGPIGMSPEEFKKMQEQAQLELAAAEQARRAAEEARLSAEETEKRLKLLEAELAARLEKAKQIAETTGGKIEVTPVEKGNVLMTLRINFDFDKYVIRPTEYETMFKVVDILQTYEGSKVWLAGHTDYIGTDEYNMKLSESRMSSVMVFLDRHGVDRSRFFMPVPYGEWKPLTENRTEEQRFRNRRVEFYIYTGDNQPVIPDGSKIETIVVQGDSAITIVGNGRLNYTSSFLGNPSRLLLKFSKVYIPDPRTIIINRGNYQQARMAFHPEDRSTWVVFDLYAPMPIPTLYSEGRRLLLPLQNGGQERVTPTTERRPNE